ncbi:MAG TPA: hypothetical protein VEF89_34235 [Solirubrobacteraceae bacterium]|nr:hypothetical protein [Solirubrobacteraceae bacterium]
MLRLVGARPRRRLIAPAALDPAALDPAALDPAPRYRVALVHGGNLSLVGALLVEELAAFFADAQRPPS